MDEDLDTLPKSFRKGSHDSGQTPDPRRQAKAVRNRTLVERRRRGETYASIAADYGISGERVRQIVQREEGRASV